MKMFELCHQLPPSRPGRDLQPAGAGGPASCSMAAGGGHARWRRPNPSN